MFRFLNFSFASIIIFLTSCSLFGIGEEGNEANAYSPVWEYDFNVGYFSSLDPIIYKDKAIYTALDEKRSDFMANNTLEAFDKETGKIIWRWNETVDRPGDQFHFKGRYHIWNNILHISSGVDYAINLDNGATNHYLNEAKYSGQAFFGKENKIYSTFSVIEPDLQLFRGNIMVTNTDSYDWKLFLKGFISDSTVIGYNQVLFDENNPNLVYLPYTEGYWGIEKVFTGIAVYDMLKEEIILERKYTEIGDNYPVEQLSILHEDRIFIPTRGKTICIDKNTGELLWQTKVNGNASRSGILYTEDDGLYVNTEFYIYSLNPENGNINWQTDSRGGSRLQYHNGVIYYTAGALLRAVDATTGEKLLAIEAPSRADDDGAYFQPVLTIDHDNDRIYTASYTHAYCYPTLR